MTRVYGRGKPGERVVDPTPHGHWNTTTLVAGISRKAPLAPMVLKGPMDAVAFETYIKRVLIPELPEGAIVAMDNLSSHKSPRIPALLEEAHCEVRYLPPYSPDFNPIEHMWSKVKNHLKSAKARSQESLYEAIREAFAKVTLHDAESFFAHCFVGINS